MVKVMRPSVEDMRQIEWSKAWMWDVKFDDNSGLGPFKEWLPATSVEENIFTLEEHNFTAGLTSVSIPKNTAVFDLKITFVDDVKLTIEHWLDHWVNEEILGNGEWVATLEEAVKTVILAKKKPPNEVVSVKRYQVFPKGALYFSGESKSGTHSNEIEFIIAGSK